MQDFMYKTMFEYENTHWWFQAKKHIITSLIKDKVLQKFDRPINIADIGCGVGLLLNSLSQLGNVTGIDYSNQALDFCRENFNGELIQADCGTSININKKYDLVIASDLIEHIKDETIIIENIYNLLNPNGYAIITVPAFQFLWSQHDVNNMHYRRYELNQLKGLIKSSRFKIEYISYYNFFLFIPAFIVRIIKKVLKIDKKGELELKTPPSIINKLMYKIFSSEYTYISKKKRFPFGLSLIAVIKRNN